MRAREVMAAARRAGPAARVAALAICVGMSACGRVPLDAPVILTNGGTDAHVAIDARSDARPTNDARPDATALCSTDGGLQTYQSVVSGEIDGPEIDGVVCAGGAFAYLERTVYGKFLMLIENSYMGDPSRRFQFQKPANVASGDLFLLTDIDAPTPGTYTSGQTCGSVALCTYFPTPALDCGVSSFCPPGCAPEGPVSAPTCTPVAPYICYAAAAASDCLGYPQTVQGSWTLNLTSVEVYENSPEPGNPFYVVHGALSANLIGGTATGGDEPATLSLAF